MEKALAHGGFSVARGTVPASCCQKGIRRQKAVQKNKSSSFASKIRLPA
jgi:hypothetical protein